MRLRCSGAMPDPESETTASTCPLTSVATRRRPPPGIDFLGIEQQVEKDLLQLAGVAVNGGQIVRSVPVSTIDLRGLELMLEQRKRIANDLVQIRFAELGGGGAREIEQAVGDF